MTTRRPSRKTATLDLASVLDVRAAGGLYASLAGLRGRPVVLDAGAVERLGGQCLQVLLAASAAWRADGAAFSFATVSDGFRDGLALLGFSVESLLGKEEGA